MHVTYQDDTDYQAHENGNAASSQHRLIVLEGKHSWRHPHLLGCDQPCNDATAAASDGPNCGAKAGAAIPKEGKKDRENCAGGCHTEDVAHEVVADVCAGAHAA